MFAPVKICFIAMLVAASSSSFAAGTVRYLNVNGMDMPYVEQGKGPPLVLVHGAVSDLRTWDRQRAALATHYRAIAVTQRYYGDAPWGPDWPKYSIETHVNDLAAFIRALDAGPVSLAAWSSGGHIALTLALRSPDLLRGVFVYEPVVSSYVEDPEKLKAIGDDASALVGPVLPKLKEGEVEQAARLFVDSVAEHPGYFDSLPATSQEVVLANARALPLMFDGGEQDSPITCKQMAEIKPRVAIARGEKVRPFFRIIADAAARCNPRATHIIVPEANHMWPGEDPAGFARVVHGFLSGN
jgi:pimeloyl-ACP methyl ester carboxylesterase